MKQNKNENYFESDEMEKWLTQYFLDPLTDYLDENVFRIDLFDSESSFIVEALLPKVKKEDIHISINSNILQIKVKQSSHDKTRTVTFPFPISHLQKNITFENDILEIVFLKSESL